MPRLLDDWLTAFLDYTEHMEAPRLMRTWAGISAVASCLRKRVWIDQDQFVWTPGLYIIFVGPPGVITKSTTTDMASSLLREVPGIKWGPNNVTWQALATAFAASAEQFEHPEGSGDWHPMSPITLVSRELGSLLNPRDQDLVNLFIELYDGAKVYEKVTKMSGNDTIEAPWINMLGATTPSWIADNVPKSALGGGLVSRIIFLYGDEKEKLVAYPKRQLKNLEAQEIVRKALVNDLEHIAQHMTGGYELTEEAYKWGEEWYERLWTGAKQHYSDDKMMGYIARKQTHMHKVAMVLAATRKDELVITKDELELADTMLCSVESCLDKVFAQIGRTEESIQAARLIEIVSRRGGMQYEEVYRTVHSHFPDHKDFEGIIEGAIRSGQLVMVNTAKGVILKANGSPLSEHNSNPIPQPIPEVLNVLDQAITAPNS
jgi:hypothetical protein